MALSQTRIDRLGVKLRSGDPTEGDLRLLAAHRESFYTAYAQVVEIIRGVLRLEVTGRPGKTTGSITAKLRRQSLRLSQMQDIAGCRIVVEDLTAQDDALRQLAEIFHAAQVDDRRQKPSFGYRAVHLIVKIEGKPVEIQVRTQLQHLWAEVSEALADRYTTELKYGGEVEDRPGLRAELLELGDKIAEYETLPPAEKGSKEALDRLLKSAEILLRAIMLQIAANPASPDLGTTQPKT
jgi:putative GTP pyrophosphokinase